jgi:hypothetical protein
MDVVRQTDLRIAHPGSATYPAPDMIRFLFRFLATVSLAAAVIMAVLDATRTVAAKNLVMTPLLSSLEKTFPRQLAQFRAFLEQNVHSLAWDPVAVAVLALPGFVVFAILAFLLYALGRRPRRRIGRFVVDE